MVSIQLRIFLSSHPQVRFLCIWNTPPCGSTGERMPLRPAFAPVRPLLLQSTLLRSLQDPFFSHVLQIDPKRSVSDETGKQVFAVACGYINIGSLSSACLILLLCTLHIRLAFFRSHDFKIRHPGLGKCMIKQSLRQFPPF